MSKKLILWIGIAAAVVVAAAVALIIILSGSMLPKSPAAFGETLNEGKNYTLTVTNEDGEGTVMLKRQDGKYYYALTGDDTTIEIYIEKTDGKYNLYTKDGDKWTYKSVEADEVERYLVTDELSNEEDVFKSDNYKKEGNVYTYTGENKKFKDLEFTNLTLETGSESTKMRIVSESETISLSISDVNKTKVTLPEATKSE